MSMFAHYLALALRSLARSPGLTGLMILAVGLGVAASMTTYAVFRAVSGDPIPWKSSTLYVPQIDIWGPQNGAVRKEPPDALDYFDAVALMRDHQATHQSPLYQIAPPLVPAEPYEHPRNILGHAVFGEFFQMVDAPFLYGAGWGVQEDEQRAVVVVVSSALNRQLFGGRNSVGRTINLNGKDFRVTGVLNDWNPQPRFYDVHNSGGFTTETDDVFIPFNTAIVLAIPNNGNTNCSKPVEEAGFAGLQRSTCVWISYLVELRDLSARAAYRRYLDNYAANQQSAGRFAWAPNNRLRDLSAWLDFEAVVPSDTKVSLLVAFGLLLVCLINTTGLLLAKFLRRRAEVGIRRALGATRQAIYTQFVTEAGLVGAAGGVLGLLLTGVGVIGVRSLLPADIAYLAHLDSKLLLLCMAVAVIATTLAGLYPAFRASIIGPALQLNSN
jgi:putative ABC transport system permease protein